ncbi:ATP-binding cassette domain-containing protein [Gelidibacter maritimus]|uniref:ATP-binding cassette domain-containing protein n=1 Tax=Gelidibacter maritimus TaxID=2761487 RepID=A0A7W2R3A3_9FLAO|nr:ATP-binding cassette domain-containing protein [Gelidibacter maritimus]MBA6151795.1 ATP-binding cassette domain-containing protein [Gelidibacter maritimus]
MSQSLIHYGIVVSNSLDKKAFTHHLLSKKSTGALRVFNELDGVLFSDLAIAELIEKEHKHHTIEITTPKNRPLHTFSSGERRKLFLEYCLSKNPDYIIFDNPFDHLDQASRMALYNQLLKLSHSISILQLVHHERDLMPFIKKTSFVSGTCLVVSESDTKTQPQTTQLKPVLPSALVTFTNTYNVLVKFYKVSVNYGEQSIVKNISWEIKHGEFWQLIGPNGSGKSTLLALITGDNPKAFGQDITIFDRKKGSGESVWDIKKNIGYFSTHLTELFERNHTVGQMVLSGFFDSVGLYVKPSAMQQQKALQWLDVIEMRHLKDAYFNRLSLGQQRLVLIIRAVIKQPPLLILDEPFEGLDPENTALVSQLINGLVEYSEIAIIYVSHTIENSLAPSHIYELMPTNDGSIGRIKPEE